MFSSEPLFTAAVDKAFRTVINGAIINSSSDGPETLARYCDMMLKKNAVKKEMNTATIENKKKTVLRKTDDNDLEEKLARMVIKLI